MSQKNFISTVKVKDENIVTILLNKYLSLKYFIKYIIKSLKIIFKFQLNFIMLF